MIRNLMIAVVLSLSWAMADEVLYREHFRPRTWRVINTANFVEMKQKALELPDEEIYIRIYSGECPFGAKIHFSAENETGGVFKLGLIVYGKTCRKYFSEELKGKGVFVMHLPEKAKSLGMMIQGAGRYRNINLKRIVDSRYHITAEPAYQMTSGTVQPVTFTLYKDGVKVPDAVLQETALEAVHQESGVSVSAFAETADTSRFDEVAGKIKLEKPVSILYLGDSLTHFDIGHNHVDKVGFFLNKFNPGKVQVWNYACGGDDIRRILQRLHGKAPGRWKNRYHDLWSRKYDWAVIFVGHNDTKASSVSQYKNPMISPDLQRECYEKILSVLKEKGIRRILLFSSTSSNFSVCMKNAERIKRNHNRFGEPVHLENFNRVVAEIAAKHHLEYVDLYSAMKKMENKAELLNPRDGVHLTNAGHDYVALQTLKYFALHPESEKH